MWAVYVRLLKLYPSSFRARFGEELVQFVRDEAAHGRRVHWTRTFADLFGSALVQRWRESNMRPKFALGLLAVVLLLLPPFLVVGSEFSMVTLLVLLVELAVVAVLVGAGALLGRRVRGAEYDYARPRFRWWWIGAGLLGAAEVVMPAGQLIDDPKATNVAAMLILWGFAALVFGGMAMRNRRVGNYMIAAGVVPATTLFWLIFPALIGLFVIVNALADNYRIANPRPAV